MCRACVAGRAAGGVPAPGIRLEPLPGIPPGSLPPAAAAPGKGAAFHNGSVLPRPGSPSRAASCPEKARNWFSPCPGAARRGASLGGAPGEPRLLRHHRARPGGVTAPSPPLKPEPPKNPSGYPLCSSRAAAAAGQHRLPHRAWRAPGWLCLNFSQIAKFPLAPAVLICFLVSLLMFKGCEVGGVGFRW